MWVVAKIKSNEFDMFKKELEKKLQTKPLFYNPKIQIEKNQKSKIKKFSRSILENYIFCFNKSFNDTKFTQQLKFVKGLRFFLNGYNLNQKEIVDFINYCKSFENNEGFIKALFFKRIISKKAKFISGPFTNMFFDIIEKQKNKLKIIVGGIVTTVPYDKNYLYRPVWYKFILDESTD